MDNIKCRAQRRDVADRHVQGAVDVHQTEVSEFGCDLTAGGYLFQITRVGDPCGLQSLAAQHLNRKRRFLQSLLVPFRGDYDLLERPGTRLIWRFRRYCRSAYREYR